MHGTRMRSALVGIALLLTAVGGSLAASATTASAHDHAHRRPIPARTVKMLRYRWRHFHPTLIGQVVTDASSGGIFGTGQIQIQGPFGHLTQLTLDGLTRAYAAGSGPGHRMERINPADIPPGSVVVVRGELVNTGPLYVAIRIFDTGFGVPSPTPTPTATPTPTPTATPTPSPLRVIGRVRATDSGSGGMFDEGTLVVRAPSGRRFLFELSGATTACVYYGPVKGCTRISPSQIELGDEVIVRGATIPGHPHVFLANAIVDTTRGIRPHPTPTPTATPTPTPTATPAVVRVIGRVRRIDSGSTSGTLVVRAPSGRRFLFEITTTTTTCVYHGPVKGCSRISPTQIDLGDEVIVRGVAVAGHPNTFVAETIVDTTLGTRTGPAATPTPTPKP
ncbi:MAG TPA: hypothetical protein VNN74_08020 [Candidatus Micrarchaeia archaeon]|nr:hypothetical protein [Candidatus Micrarchaeia archaeon]